LNIDQDLIQTFFKMLFRRPPTFALEDGKVGERMDARVGERSFRKSLD